MDLYIYRSMVGWLETELRSRVKVEVAVWAPVPNKPTDSVDVKQHSTKLVRNQVNVLCHICNNEVDSDRRRRRG